MSSVDELLGSCSPMTTNLNWAMEQLPELRNSGCRDPEATLLRICREVDLEIKKGYEQALAERRRCAENLEKAMKADIEVCGQAADFTSFYKEVIDVRRRLDTEWAMNSRALFFSKLADAKQAAASSR